MSVAHAHTAPALRSHTVRLTIPAKAEYISLVRLALSGLSGLRPLSDEALGDLKLAVTEACTNSIRHGYRNSEGAVEVVYQLLPDRLVVEVADNGPGFDAAGDRPMADSLAEGGLGIAIIKAVSDEFEAGHRPDGHGSRLRFAKLFEK
jgi:serine/threonine-protein kinase RsbW